MEIEYDPVKSARNLQERGISFESAMLFELEESLIKLDIRRNYREARFNAIGYIGERLHHMTFTVRVDVIRVISLRKANQREVNRYAKA
ncbi:MAG: BrnT family toxin [Thiolinea sp.]